MIAFDKPKSNLHQTLSREVFVPFISRRLQIRNTTHVHQDRDIDISCIFLQVRIGAEHAWKTRIFSEEAMK